MLKRACLLFVAIILVGCAARNNTRLAQTMDAWVGHPISEVTTTWGPPTTVYDEAPYKVYAWHLSQTYGGGSRPGTQYNYQTHEYQPAQVGNPVHTSNTYRMFWVNADGTVAKWKFGRQ